MKICFPVEVDKGPESTVFDHFGSAPMFLVVDSESEEITAFVNRDLDHAHGGCSPLKALDGAGIDVLVVGGIGGGALLGLSRMGVRVYIASGETVAENLSQFSSGTLAELTAEPAQQAAGHSCCGHNGGCGHKH